MSTQTDLPLPPARAPRVLSLDQVRALLGTALADLITASPRIAASLAQLAVSAPGSRLAALAAVYGVASEDERRLIRTVRALTQLLIDAEAHAARQPGARRAAAVPAIAATEAALPLPDPFQP